jgi:hypothetical protein
MTDDFPDPSERDGRWVLGIADMFELLLPELRKLGRVLIASARTRQSTNEKAKARRSKTRKEAHEQS